MYKLSNKDRARITSSKLPGYPDGVVGDQIEAEIEKTLPPISKLTHDMTIEARVALLAATTEFERARFTAKHGNPFGCEIDADASKITTGRSVKYA